MSNPTDPEKQSVTLQMMLSPEEISILNQAIEDGEFAKYGFVNVEVRPLSLEGTDQLKKNGLWAEQPRRDETQSPSKTEGRQP